jgi:hypothetical protein
MSNSRREMRAPHDAGDARKASSSASRDSFDVTRNQATTVAEASVRELGHEPGPANTQSFLSFPESHRVSRTEKSRGKARPITDGQSIAREYPSSWLVNDQGNAGLLDEDPFKKQEVRIISSTKKGDNSVLKTPGPDRSTSVSSRNSVRDTKPDRGGRANPVAHNFVNLEQVEKNVEEHDKLISEGDWSGTEE